MHNRPIGRPMEVLLVEDSLTDARLTIAALESGKLPHRLTLIRDGEEAMEFLRRDGKFARAPRPDLVLLDLLLPKKDGLTLLAEVRAEDALRGLPIVVLTGSNAEEDRQSCRAHHVDSYITKPVNMEKFIAVVRQLRRHLLADVILPALVDGAAG